MIAALLRNLSPFRITYPSPFRKSHPGFEIPPFPLRNFSTSGETQSPVYEFLVHKHHFSPQSASHISSVVTHLSNPARSDSLLSFLKENGFSTSQLENTFKSWPKLLLRSVDKTVIPRIKIFKDFGLSASDIAIMLSKDPWILNQSANKMILPSLTLLKSLVGANGLAKALKAYDAGWFFRFNLNKLLVPNFELMKKCGVSVDQMIWMLYHCPRVLLRKPEDVKKSVDKAYEMGASGSSRQFIHAVRVISQMSDETLELKLRTLRELGFLDEDITALFRTTPTVFCLSAERIKMVIEFLMSNGKYDLSCIVCNPVALTLSIEKRYKPRLQVLELLEHKKLIKKWPGLSQLCRMTDKQFHTKYVVPYSCMISELST